MHTVYRVKEKKLRQTKTPYPHTTFVKTTLLPDSFPRLTVMLYRERQRGGGKGVGGGGGGGRRETKSYFLDFNILLLVLTPYGLQRTNYTFNILLHIQHSFATVQKHKSLNHNFVQFAVTASKTSHLSIHQCIITQVLVPIYIPYALPMEACLNHL